MSEEYGMYPAFNQRKVINRSSFLRIFLRNMSVTSWLIVANVLFFFVTLLIGAFSNPDCTLTICRYLAIQPHNLIGFGFVWTLITSMFMHGRFLHLLVNMLVLFSLGGLCERIIGRKRFFRFYILAGIFAGLLFVALAYFFGNSQMGVMLFGGKYSYAVGASGAIFAIAGLFVVLTPKMKFYIIFLPFFSLPAYIMVPLVLIVTWAVSVSTGLAVGNTAHLGGFLYGLIYGFYLRCKYKSKTKAICNLFSG